MESQSTYFENSWIKFVLIEFSLIAFQLNLCEQRTRKNNMKWVLFLVRRNFNSNFAFCKLITHNQWRKTRFLHGFLSTFLAHPFFFYLKIYFEHKEQKHDVSQMLMCFLNKQYEWPCKKQIHCTRLGVEKFTFKKTFSWGKTCLK